MEKKIRCIFLSLFLLVSYFPMASFAKPYVPTDDLAILEIVRTSDPTYSKLKKLAVQLKKDPENLELAVKLSEKYLSLSRTTGDPRYVSYAEFSLKPWLEKENSPEAVLVIKAGILQYRHNFQSALEVLAKVLTRNPRNIQARLIRANIYRVQGNYAEAISDCRALLLLADPLVSGVCQTAISSLTGKAEWSYNSLKNLYKTRGETAPPDVRSWAQVTLGKMALSLGKKGEAEKHFLLALKIEDTPNTYIRSAYLDFLIDQDKAKEAYNSLKQQSLSDALLLRKAIAAKKLGKAEADNFSNILKSRFMDSSARGDKGHLREEARFELQMNQNPDRALVLAKKNWEKQREPEDILLVLQAAVSAKQYSSVSHIVTWVEKNKLEDVRINSLINQIKGAL